MIRGMIAVVALAALAACTSASQDEPAAPDAATCRIDPAGTCATDPGLACCAVTGLAWDEARGCWAPPSPIDPISGIGVVGCIGPLDPRVEGCSGPNVVQCFTRTEADGGRTLLVLPSGLYGAPWPSAPCKHLDAGTCP